MILKAQSNFEVITPVKTYADKLCYYMKNYLNLMEYDFSGKSFNRNKKGLR